MSFYSPLSINAYHKPLENLKPCTLSANQNLSTSKMETCVPSRKRLMWHRPCWNALKLWDVDDSSGKGKFDLILNLAITEAKYHLSNIRFSSCVLERTRKRSFSKQLDDHHTTLLKVSNLLGTKWSLAGWRSEHTKSTWRALWNGLQPPSNKTCASAN